MEPVLPLVTVGNGRKLEWGAVKQDKLLVCESVHLLDLVAQLNVLRDGLVKICHSGSLLLPTAEKAVLVDVPDHLVA